MTNAPIANVLTRHRVRQPDAVLGLVERVPVAEHAACFDHQDDRPAAALADFRRRLHVRRQVDVVPIPLGQSLSWHVRSRPGVPGA